MVSYSLSFLYIKLPKYKTSTLVPPLSPSYTHTHTYKLHNVLTVEPLLKRHPGILSNCYNILLFRTNS